MELFADYHTHTLFSHGKGRVEDNVKAALKRGLEEVAITDHGPANPFVGIRGLKVLRKIKEEIYICQKKYPSIKILLGLEANVITLSGKLDISPRYIRELDLLLVGLHPGVIPGDSESLINLTFKNWGSYFSQKIRAQVRLTNTLALINAVKKYPAHIVVHPGLKLSIDTPQLARICALRGVALEINSSHGEKTREYLKAALPGEVKFVINSDAHSPEEVGELEGGLDLAHSLGIEKERIINAR
ncbi:MAG: PHP domain-containing protein [Candidatus Syntrophonatronum acetioxidans]|uniref:PHP domain-containing protein n=1 Tax=Candidatus Syntrophonatronum acetioxidans TaxID=1795816 RepID=A0A424YCD2_9FIRM|nr:MAG: PHP domain-containing protein [Candidatus Syntrophonatronum acetioxidans]